MQSPARHSAGWECFSCPTLDLFFAVRFASASSAFFGGMSADSNSLNPISCIFLKSRFHSFFGAEFSQNHPLMRIFDLFAYAGGCTINVRMNAKNKKNDF